MATHEVKACSKPPANLELLQESLIKAATQIDMNLLRVAIDDWPRSMKACIRNPKGHFK